MNTRFGRRLLYVSLAAIVSLAMLPGCAGSRETEDKGEEEVNIGYGTQQKKDVTGAVASVSGDEAKDRHATQLQDLLKGRVAGVRVEETSEGIRVRVRGESSIMGSNEPLYVVDGMPVAPGPGGVLFINPSDVASIEVLKDASSTAIYGSRGANGVILVTTRRGGEPAKQ